MAKYIASRGDAKFAELAEMFGVSQMTAYRDVAELESLGVLRRIRGGVTSQPSSVFESNLEYRSTIHRSEKEAITAVAFERVRSGMSIMIDDGTTLMSMAPMLMSCGQITVMTGFLPLISALSHAPEVDLIVIGGSYQSRHDCVSGVLSEDMIAQLRADLLFISPSAIADGKIMHQEQDMVAVKRAMMNSCDEKILLADHSKLGRRATHVVAGLEDFDHVITDDGTSADALAHIEDYGAKVLLARVHS